MPFPRYVPSDEVEAPRRNALERFLSAMPEPGIVQQAGMLKEHLASLGPVQAAARTADDLGSLFQRMGPIGLGDLANPVQAAGRVGRGLVEPATEALAPVGAALDRFDAEQQAGLEEGYARFKTPSETREQAVRRGERMMELGTAVAMGGPDTTKLVGAGQRAAGAVERAGNLNLAKFPEEVRGLLTRAADEGGEFLAQRRGTISDAQAATNAVDTGLGTTAQQWLKSKPGRAFNQEEATALGNTLARVGQEYDGLLTHAAEARAAGTVTAAQEAELAEKALEFGALASVRSGAAAEAGRALRSFRTALSGAEGSGYGGIAGATREQAIGRAFQAIGTTPERFGQWVDEFSKLDPGDVQGKYMMLQALYKPSLMDNLTTWRYASMLSGWKTHLANFTSNAGEAAARPILEAHAGYGRAAANDVRAMVGAIPEAWAAAGKTFLTGVSRDVASKAELTAARPQALMGSKLGRAVRAPLDLLSAADEFWKVINYSGALNAEATKVAQRTGQTVGDVLADPQQLVRLHERATQAARVATFTEDPGAFVNSLLRVRAGEGPGALLTQFMLPFVRTPANIFKRAAGMVVAPVREGLIRAPQAFARGDTEAGRMALGRAAVASEALAGIAALTANGLITGAGPQDATRRRELEATGWQPNSARIGDTYVSLANLGPIGQEAIWIANAYEAATQGKPDATLEDRINDATRRLGQVLVDTSYLSGLGDFFQSVQTGSLTGSLTNLAGSVAGSLVPYGSALATAERVGDPVTRSRETVPDQVAGRIPGLSGLVPPERDIYGQERRSFEGTLEGIVLPWRSSRAQNDPVAREVARLVQTGRGVPVPSVSQREEYEGEKQTREQRSAINAELGQNAKRYIESVINQPGYQRLTDDQKAASLKRAVDAARALADLRIGERAARDPKSRADLEWARTPQFEGVKGNADEVAIQNLEIREAKALLQEYKQRYGEDQGELRLLREDRRTFLLSQREGIDRELLSLRRRRIDQRLGVEAEEAKTAPLPGAGNRPIIPRGGGGAGGFAFTAP